MRVKIYYNNSKDVFPWIVKVGNVEHFVRAIVIQYPGMTSEDHNADNVAEPKAWIEFVEARVEIRNEVARIY